MADIVIRGMEMPLFKTELIVFPSGVVQVYDSRENYLGKAQAVPLPEGHGRLGDLDKINASLEAMIEIEHNQRAAPYSWSHAYMEMQGILDDAPIIVPAEGGTSE